MLYFKRTNGDRNTRSGEFKYIFKRRDGEEKEAEESNVFPSFEKAKSGMEEIVKETLSEVRALGKDSIRYL